MEIILLKRILKGGIGAIIFDILVELWIFIEISYNNKWSFHAFAIACTVLSVLSTKAKCIKNCILNLSVFWMMCVAVWILIELIKSEFKIYSRIFSFELGAGDGFAMIAIYMYSVIIVVSGSIISMLMSWWCQKRSHLK